MLITLKIKMFLKIIKLMNILTYFIPLIEVVTLRNQFSKYFSSFLSTLMHGYVNS